MNTREIERLWKQATKCPHHDTNWYDPMVVEFAALVAAAEREACAKLCDEARAARLAEQIRARGNT